MRVAAPIFICTILMTACGSANPGPVPAAVVNGSAITRADLQQSVDYSLRFYNALNGTRSPDCSSRAALTACSTLRAQVLARLIEERLVLDYAAHHHTFLGKSDKGRVLREVDNLKLGDAAGGRLYKALGVDRSFVRGVLEREMLVRKVEEMVAPPSTKRGPSVQLDRISILFASDSEAGAARKAALTLATDGGPVPATARVRRDWIAVFRLPAIMRTALDAATPGQFVGPFRQAGAYMVVHMLRRGQHGFGRPARTKLQTAYFQTWVNMQLRRASVKCFDGRGKEQKCPVQR